MDIQSMNYVEKYEMFVQDKIAQYRIQNGMSALDLSLQIDRSRSYINNVENKKAIPSLRTLFCICECLDITPGEFFDESNDSQQVKETLRILRQLSEEEVASIKDLAMKLIK